ncbi:MAG: phytoene desaturase family protein [Phycisphaerae bacterium]|nr:phytoene desaturase family protein [Phycisphaerae bacterium]
MIPPSISLGNPHRTERRTSADPSIGIVGAGPGGLATAMLLARAGCHVTLYEALPSVGGRTRRLEFGVEDRRFAFDCGPTFFMMPYILEEIFAATGRRLSDYADLTRLDPMYRLLIGRGGAQAPLQIDATQDLQRMVRQFAAIEPGDGPAFLRFMSDNRRKLELMTPILRRPMRSLADLLTVDALRVAPALTPWKSLYDLLSSYFTSEQLRLALSFQSKYLGMSPFECPSLFSILSFIEYEYGVWHPRGGCNALTSAMADVCLELGATIRCNAEVDQLLFEGQRCVGAVVHGTEHRHDHMVLNADATWAMKRLVPERLRSGRGQGGWSDAQIDTKRYSCSTFMMYLGVRGGVALPHHTIYTSAHYRQNIEDIAVGGTLSNDPSIYVCNPSPVDPTLAPAGDSSLYVLMPTPNTKSGIDWNIARAVARDRAYTQLEQVFGLEDIRDRVVSEHLVTPDDWRAERINHGATFNLAHSLPQMLFRRPQHKLQGFEGLWLVGGGTHPGSGLPVIFLSAEITARLVCAEAELACPLDAAPSPADPTRPWSKAFRTAMATVTTHAESTA